VNEEFFAEPFIGWYVIGMPASRLLEDTFNRLYFLSLEILSLEQASCVILYTNAEPDGFCD
jgi:hypothetical protein